MNFEWGHNRRFNSYPEYFRKMFGERVQKISVNAGFTCPNRDGKISHGGCIFCNNEAFNPSYCSNLKSITQQIEEGIEFHKKRYRRASKYLAYFQAYSNTYDTVENLKIKYSEALNYENVIGLIIGTRPDCLENKVLDYLEELSEKYYLMIELGVESCSNETLRKINRGHTFEQVIDTLSKLKKRNIKTGIHLMFGLPDESLEQMLSYSKIISELPINNIKFHQLQIFKNSKLHDLYKDNPDRFTLFSLDEYVDFIIKFIENLNPNIVIERFNSEVPPRFLAYNSWGLIRMYEVLLKIEKELEARNTWQGKKYKVNL